MAKRKKRAISGVLVRDKCTGETKVFKTAEDAAKYTGISPFIIRHACSEESHHSHRPDSFESQYAFNNGTLVKRQRCKYCPYDFADAKLKIVAAYLLEDARVAVSFCSAQECIDYLGISTNTYYLRRAEVLENMRKAGVDSSMPKYMFFSDTVRAKDGRKWYLRFYDDEEGIGVLDPFVLPTKPVVPDPPATDVVDNYNAEHNIDEDTQRYFSEHPEDVSLNRLVENIRQEFTPDDVRAIKAMPMPELPSVTDESDDESDEAVDTEERMTVPDVFGGGVKLVESAVNSVSSTIATVPDDDIDDVGDEDW